MLGVTGPLSGLARFGASRWADALRCQSYDLGEFLHGLEDDATARTRWRWLAIFAADVVREVAYGTLTKSGAGAAARRDSCVSDEWLRAMGADRTQMAHHAATSAAELVGEIGPGRRRGARTIKVRTVRWPCSVEQAARSLDVGAFSQAIRQTSRARDAAWARAPISDAGRTLQLTLMRAPLSGAGGRGERNAEVDADAEQALEVVRWPPAMSATKAKARRLILGIRSLRQSGEPRLRRRRELSSAASSSCANAGARHLSSRRRCATGGSSEVSSAVRWRRRTGCSARPKPLAAERLDDRRGRAWVRQHQAWVAFLSGDTRARRGAA